MSSLIFAIWPYIAYATATEDMPINYGMLTPLVEHYNHLYAKSESISGLLTSDACKTHRNLLDVNITVATILNILETQAKFQTEISFINWNENLSLISVQTSQLLETAFFDSEYFKYDTKNDPVFILMDDEIKQQVNKSTFLSVLFSMFTGVDQKKEFAMLLYEMLIHDLVSIGIEGEILDIIKGKIEKILLNLNDLCRSLQWYIGRNTPDYEANIQFMADVQVVYNPTEVSGGLSYAQVSSAVDSMLIQPLRSMFQKGIKEEQTSKLDNKKLAKLAEDFSHKYSKEIVPDVCRLYHIYFLHQICILKGIDKDSDKNIDYKPVFTRIFSNIEILDAISCIISSIPVICRMQRVIRTEMLSKVVLDGINYELLDKTIENMLKSSKNLPSGILKVLVDKTTVVLNENIKNVKFFFDDINDVTSVLKNALFLSTFRVSQAEHLDDFIQLASAIKNKAILKRTLAVYSFPLILRALTSGESLAKASIDKLSKSKSLLKISVSKLHTGSIKPLTHEIFRKCSSALKRMELIESYKTYALYTLILLVVFDFILLVLVVSSPKF